MNTNEKFAKLDALVVETGISEEELTWWFKSRQTLPATTDGSSPSLGGIKSIFPIAYKKGDEFEIFQEFIPERKDEIWGYEIMPNIILAKKCGADGNVESTSWDNAKAFAEKCVFNGKRGHLPSVNALKRKFYEEPLMDKVDQMDNFMLKKGIDAERKFYGTVWCFENVDLEACCFNLKGGYADWSNKAIIFRYYRLSVAF